MAAMPRPSKVAIAAVAREVAAPAATPQCVAACENRWAADIRSAAAAAATVMASSNPFGIIAAVSCMVAGLAAVVLEAADWVVLGVAVVRTDSGKACLTLTPAK